MATEVGETATATAEVGAILLAAGASRRMGVVNKLLLPVDGVPMVVRVADAVRAAGLPMLVVLGHEADAVRAALSREHGGGMRAQASGVSGGAECGASAPSLTLVASPPVPLPRARERVAFVEAPDWAEGMGASLAAGARAIPAHWAGAIVCLGDMPFVGADLLGRLAAALDGPEAVAVPVHRGRRGNPVGWGRAWFPELARLGGDAGGRGLLAGAQVTEIEAGEGALRDVDTPGDVPSAFNAG